jgi:hypothetical protein
VSLNLFLSVYQPFRTAGGDGKVLWEEGPRGKSPSQERWEGSDPLRFRLVRLASPGRQGEQMFYLQQVLRAPVVLSSFIGEPENPSLPLASLWGRALIQRHSSSDQQLPTSVSFPPSRAWHSLGRLRHSNYYQKNFL